MSFDYNILAYLIYLPIMVVVIIKIGTLCHDNGEVWTMELYQDREFVKALNRLLLLAYYLLNIGYAIVAISIWETVESLNELITTITTRAGFILLSLAVLHYMNIGVIALWYKIKNNHLKN